MAFKDCFRNVFAFGQRSSVSSVRQLGEFVCSANGAVVNRSRLLADADERFFLLVLLLSHSFDENSSSELLLDESEHLHWDFWCIVSCSANKSSPPDSESESEQLN